jgi:hypothetical protein
MSLAYLNNCKERPTEREGWCITASTLSQSYNIPFRSWSRGGGVRFYKTFGQKLAQFLCSPPLVALMQRWIQSHHNILVYCYISQLYASATSGCKVKVKVTLEQTTKAQRGSRGIACSFFNLGARWGGWSTPRPSRLPPGKDPVPIVPEAWWAPRPVWTGAENLASHWGSIPGPSSP